MVVTSIVIAPMTASAVDTPQALESSTIKLWADPENTLTQDDIDAFNAGTKTSMVGAVGVFKRSSSSSNYYLFLPSDADCTNLRFWYVGTSASVTVDGVTTNLVNGETTDAFKDIAAGGVSKNYTIKLGSSSYTVTAMKSGDVGAVYIDTTSGSMSTVAGSSDHSKSEAGTVMVVDADGNVNYDGEMEKIQGRGNGTWSTSNSKNPYNVKLAVSTSLLGMAKAKKWVLLANNNDSTLVVNQLTYDFADYIGIKYQPHCKPVDVYVNQQYYGSYQLAEKVEIKSNRIDVTDAYENLEIANGTVDETTGLVVPADLSTAPAALKTASGGSGSSTSGSYTVGTRKYSTNQAGSGSSSGGSTGGLGGIIGGIIGGSGSTGTGPALINPDDVTGGYLYELEISQRWVDENAGFCAYNRQGWVMKSCDVATKEMVDYSYDLLYALGASAYNGGTVPSAATTTSCSSGKTSVRTTSNPAPAEQYQGKKWSDIVDAESLVKYYWTQEYFKNMDSSTSSTYFFKDSDSVDSKLYAGPVWDMDNAFGFDRTGSRWGHSWTSYDDWYTKNTRIYRFYASDSTTSYSTDAYAPLSLYGAFATKCPDFWAMAQSYWYSTIRPATRILLGEETDPTGTLKPISEYVNTVAKSNSMDNYRLNLNSDNPYDYNNFVTGMQNWVANRDNWIDGQFPRVDIANATASSIPSQTCTGEEITPDFTLTYNGATLTEGVDYTAEYSNNVAASKNATITVTGIGLYQGTKTITFTIGAGSLVGGKAVIPETAYAGDTVYVDVYGSNGNKIHQYINYQWKANGVNIAGATDDNYTITDADKGANITVTVSGDGMSIATVGITSNVCAVSNEEKPRGMTKTIASWDYDYTAAPEALATADETGMSYYYMATSGENATTAELTASVNAQTKSKIKWSGTADLYSNDATTITPDQTPVMGTSKTDGLAWGEYPYFETTVSTVNYEDIQFSAKLGGSKKAPRSWKLQYSIDGVNYSDVEGATYTLTSNKTMVQCFENVSLPSTCNNRAKVYVRVIVCENAAINGVDTIVGSLSGDAAINNIAIVGTSTETVNELVAPTISTSSTVGDGTTIFDNNTVSIFDNNGGADVYYTINGGEAVLYDGSFNPFNVETATKGDSVTITAYAQFEDVVSESESFTVTFAGVNISTFNYEDYSTNVSNGAVFSTGGVYGKSGKMTAYADGSTQYVPLWNSSNGAYCVSPDDGALWSADSGFTFEVPTAGYKNITFTAKAYTTGQGPNSVSLQYSTDGTTWTTVESNVQLNANGTLEQVFVTATLPSACNNLAKAYVRLATTENSTHGDDITGPTRLHNNNSKGNLYINDVVIAGEDDGTYKMPYTNKTTNYFGNGSIEYTSPSGVAMQYAVVNASSETISAGAYPAEGIAISTLSGFDPTVAGPYTITIWAGDDDDKSVFNTRAYYYKGDTVTKFSYSDTKRPLINYLLTDDGTIAGNTSGANAGTLSMYPNGETATALSYSSSYGVKASWTYDNIFATTKNLDNPKNNGYWLIKTSSKGFTDLTLNLEQISSNKGPRDWGLAYSLDGSKYTYIANSNVRAISNDASLSTVETYNNFALPAECDDQDELYIKVFINGGESVDGTELELITKGNTGINAIELSGIALPVEVNVTINTVALETTDGTTGTIPVESKVYVNGVEYQTTNGSVSVPMSKGVSYKVSATVYGTFVNAVKVTADDNASVTIPLVALDTVTDGVINAKDLAMIRKQGTDSQKTICNNSFQNFLNIKDVNYIYAK